jgi:hypothetical protein
MKLLWHSYLVLSLGTGAMKLCTETGLTTIHTMIVELSHDVVVSRSNELFLSSPHHKKILRDIT